MNQWCLEVWADYACFTRPEMKVERVSYDVPTPSAARAIFEAILWKPAIRWKILRIEVLRPLKWISVRRNEVGRTFVGPTAAMLKGEQALPLGLNVEDERQQRAGLFLRDVRYRLYAQFDFIAPAERTRNRPAAPELAAHNGQAPQSAGGDENAAKYAAMFDRRASKGQCFHRPYLGCREFACDFRLLKDTSAEPPPIDETRDLGWMLYDMDFRNPTDPTPMFFRAGMNKGVVVTDPREVEVRA